MVEVQTSKIVFFLHENFNVGESVFLKLVGGKYSGEWAEGKIRGVGLNNIYDIYVYKTKKFDNVYGHGGSVLQSIKREHLHVDRRDLQVIHFQRVFSSVSL